MRARHGLLGVCVVAASFGRTVQADTAHAPPNTQNAKAIEGRIARIDHDEFMLAVKGGTTETYQLSPAAEITRSRRAHLDDLKLGELVGCTAVENQDRELVATECELLPSGLRDRPPGRHAVGSPLTSSITGNITQVDPGPARLPAGSLDGSTATGGTPNPARARTLLIRIGHPGGSEQLLVSSLTDIRRLASADPTAIRPGARVRGLSQEAQDGTGVVQRLSVLDPSGG